VIPIENRGGRKLIESTRDFCERKNGHGVDPNRNWEVDWGVREKDFSAYEESAGEHAFSEPETYMLRQLVHDFKPHVWLNVHSGARSKHHSDASSQRLIHTDNYVKACATSFLRFHTTVFAGMYGLFLPYDHVDHIPEGHSSRYTLKMLQELNEAACNGSCAVGSGGKTVGYLAHGTATDYMYVKGNVSIAMTWEIYGDQSAGFKDCFKMFNPVTKAGHSASLIMWTNAIFQLLLQLRSHPALAHLAFVAEPITHLSHAHVPAHRGSLQDLGTDKPAGVVASRNQTHSTANVKLRDLRAQDQAMWLRILGFMFAFTFVLWFMMRKFISQRRRKRSSGH
jgi:hypothetical protein